MASEVLMTVSRDEEERARIMRAEKTELDYISEMAYQRDVGYAEGKAEGKAEEREEVARNALVKGIPFELICEITGLDLETIQRLSKQAMESKSPRNLQE